MPDSTITKNALAQSMKKLMAQKPFAKICIADICEACGMNRKSFYYHFRDKYELVNWIFQTEFVSGLRPEALKSEWELLDDLCRYFHAEKEFYRNALQVEGQNSFREYFFEVMQPVVLYLVRDLFSESAGKDYYVTFFCDGYLAVILRWLRKDPTIPPDEFLRDLHGIMMALAKKALRDDGE